MRGRPIPAWHDPFRVDDRETGRPICFASVTRDVSASTAAEAAIRHGEERFAFVRRPSGVGFCHCDLPFDVLEWDEPVKRHVHLPAVARVTIETSHDRIHPDDRGPTRAAIDRSIAERPAYRVDHRTVDPATGAEAWVRAIDRTSYGDDGTPTRFDGVTLDITEAARAEAVAANRAKDEFLATLSHELRTPPNAIVGWAKIPKSGRRRGVEGRACPASSWSGSTRTSRAASSTRGWGSARRAGMSTAEGTMDDAAPRLLIVDDDADSARMLRGDGHEVRVEFDGPAAPATAAASLPEVAPADLTHSGMGGVEVAAELRRPAGPAACEIAAVSGHGVEAIPTPSPFDRDFLDPLDPDAIGVPPSGPRARRASPDRAASVA